MKCCLHSNQSAEYLQKADEIKLLYKDRHELIDYVEKYPNATIILNIKYKDEIAWEDIKRYNIMCQKNFILALDDFNLETIETCKRKGIKFYWNYPITTFYTLHALKKLGAEYALIDSPLTHSIMDAADVGIKLRVVPNIAYYAIVPREDGVLGSWIRPEDLYLYEPYVAAIEFEDCDIKKE